MVLNYIWIGFIIVAFVVGMVKLIVFGDVEVMPAMLSSTFDSAKSGFEISLGLTGVLTLWLGIMKIGENGGAVSIMSRAIGPFFNKLFPDLPKNHPAYGSIMMNLAANMLNLDNAATPLGLKAMEQMQQTNPNKDTASNSQIMFLVLNTSGLTLIPVSIMVYRAQFGASDPSDVFIPILIATFFSTLAGLISVSIYQRINLFNKVILAYLGAMTLIVGCIIYAFSVMPQEQMQILSRLISSVVLISVIVGFIALGVIHKVNVYDSFIEGAKDGFQIAVRIIPFLISILVAVGMFRVSGAMDFLIGLIRNGVNAIGCNADFVEALPTALMKPLSGSGARGMMLDAFKTSGVDSFIGHLVSTMQGATDTTFYIIAVYFGSVGIKNTRYAVVCGLIADFVGILASIVVCYMFFH